MYILQTCLVPYQDLTAYLVLNIYIYNEPSLRIRDDKIASGQANFQSSYGHFTVGKLNGLENPNHIHICKLGSNNEQTSLKI